MSSFLHRLGRASAVNRRLVVAIWVALLAVVLGTAMTWGGTLTESFSLPGTESQEAADLLADRFPEFGGSTTTVVVAGEDLPAQEAAVRDLTDRLAAIEGVGAVTDPFAPGAVAPSGDVLRVTVGFPAPAMEVDDAVFAQVEQAVDDARSEMLQVEIGGEVATAMAREEPGGAAEAIGVMVAVAVLALTFGQVRAMGLTLLSALLGVGISVGTVLLIANLVDIPSVAEVLGIMIGLAVGIDYGLFIVSRHRAQVADGMDVIDSIALASATAGGAVVFAGSTVVIAMGGLLLVGIPFISLMAMSVVIAVVMAVALSATLLPALLGFAGPRIAEVTLPVLRHREATPTDQVLGARWSRWVTRRPWLSFLAGLLVIGVLTVPLLSLETAMPSDATAPADSSRHRAYDLVEGAFGPGFNAPLIVLVDHAALSPDEAQQALAATSEAVAADPATLRVQPPQTNAADDASVIMAIPAAGPADDATVALISRLRTDVLGAVEAAHDVTAYVAGPTAANVDIDDKLLSRLPLLMAAVIGLTFVVLMVAFRSILVPIKAAIGILLSIGAALGILVAVVQWGWGASLIGIDTATPIISFLPVMSFAILFGLSMDYEVFILSRVREEWLATGDAHDSVVHGVAVTARVITAAAAIMISVFSGFMLGDDPTVKMVGLGLASAVLIDATLVRMVLVPATMVMFDEANWWLPAWLDRLLPHVDIEGERLAARMGVEHDQDDRLAAGDGGRTRTLAGGGVEPTGHRP